MFLVTVRLDILNSIHTFNSISINNNYKYILTYFIFLFFCFYFKKINLFLSKFVFNTQSVLIIPLFFKILNLIFIMYFLINFFFILIVNFQFVDITKFFKNLTLISLFNYVYIVFYKFHYKFYFVILVLFTCFLNFLNLLDILIILISLNILISNIYNPVNFNLKKILSHFLIFIFVYTIKLYYVQLYFSNTKFTDNLVLIVNNNYIVNSTFFNYSLNFFNIFFKSLDSYVITSNNSFYFFTNIYSNNIIIDNFFKINYNLDNPISLIFYNLYYIIILIIIILIIYVM